MFTCTGETFGYLIAPLLFKLRNTDNTESFNRKGE